MSELFPRPPCMTGRDRRKFARIPLATQIRVLLPGAEERFQYLLDNLSTGGLFIRTTKPRPIGSMLKFEFSVRDGGKPIVGAGVVKWIEGDPEKIPGMGIQFTELNDEGRQEILKVVREMKIRAQ